MKPFIFAMALAVTVAPAGAGHATSFTSAGSCREYATGVTVDAARAQLLVPEGFAVADVAGTTLVAMFAQACNSSVNGGVRDSSVVSGVMVFLDPTRSPAGCQVYDFAWGDSKRTDWYEANNDLGFRTDLLEGSSLTFDGSTTLTADVPGTFAPWSTSATTTELNARAPLVSVHCHVGPRGLVRATYTHNISAMAGVGPVELGDGELWDALGARSQDVAAGVLFYFSWTGVTELIGSSS